jgi:hypothetical protein
MVRAGALRTPAFRVEPFGRAQVPLSRSVAKIVETRWRAVLCVRAGRSPTSARAHGDAALVE